MKRARGRPSRHTKAERTQIAQRILSDRQDGVPWQQTAAALNLSMASYYRYLKGWEDENFANEIRANGKHIVMRWYRDRRKALDVILGEAAKCQQAGDRGGTTRNLELYTRAYDDLLREFRHLGFLPVGENYKKPGSTEPVSGKAEDGNLASELKKIWSNYHERQRQYLTALSPSGGTPPAT